MVSPGFTGRVAGTLGQQTGGSRARFFLTVALVMKRSMAAGYAGVETELFYLDNTQMLFGDAKKSLQALVGEVKGL
jgi:hypothetical protein